MTRLRASHVFSIVYPYKWTEVQPLTTYNILFAAPSSTVGLIFQYCVFISRSLDYEAFYLHQAVKSGGLKAHLATWQQTQ